ncbi:DUF1707 domain-containing protein [Spiractinospora alimapuensis]|nr:DUF1707 domain-containing protein [Spiractinospora alimapuensis]
MRASDAERDATAKLLATALSEGRLGLEEYEQRLTEAMSARTRGELVPLTADLPVERSTTESAPAKKKDDSGWREYLNEWRTWAGGAVIMVGIWGVTSVLSGSFNYFWPAIPLAIWGVILIAGLFWPDEEGKDDEDEEDEDEDDTGDTGDTKKGDGWWG